MVALYQPISAKYIGHVRPADRMIYQPTTGYIPCKGIPMVADINQPPFVRRTQARKIGLADYFYTLPLQGQMGLAPILQGWPIYSNCQPHILHSWSLWALSSVGLAGGIRPACGWQVCGRPADARRYGVLLFLSDIMDNKPAATHWINHIGGLEYRNDSKAILYSGLWPAAAGGLGFQGQYRGDRGRPRWRRCIVPRFQTLPAGGAAPGQSWAGGAIPPGRALRVVGRNFGKNQ